MRKSQKTCRRRLMRMTSGCCKNASLAGRMIWKKNQMSFGNRRKSGMNRNCENLSCDLWAA
jgi:hypothetical protein